MDVPSERLPFIVVLILFRRRPGWPEEPAADWSVLRREDLGRRTA